MEFEKALKAVTQEFSGIKHSFNFTNCDEYGADHDLTFYGVCADLVITNDVDSVTCRIECHRSTDLSSEFTYAHSGTTTGTATSCNTSRFMLKNTVESEEFYNNYARDVSEWIRQNIKFLTENAELFYRIDVENYGDKRGDHLWGNNITSYSEFRVSDADFYVGEEIKASASKVRIPPDYSCEMPVYF